MKKLDLDFDFSGIELGELSENDVFPIVFQQLVDTAYPQGLRWQDGVQFQKITDKIQNMNGSREVELEDAEYEWAKAVVANGRLPSQSNKIALMLYRKFGLVD